MPAPFINFKVEGVQKILRKCNKTDPVFARPWTSALKEATTLAEKEMRDLAPGGLSAKVTFKMQARPVPLWSHVGLIPMPSRKGFRYPGALHGAKVRFHYRSGPHQGQNTHGWLTKPVQILQGRINALLQKASDKILSEWDS